MKLLASLSEKKNDNDNLTPIIIKGTKYQGRSNVNVTHIYRNRSMVNKY